MKSARERAEALASTIAGNVQTRTWHAIVEAAEPSFKEHARDQRHIDAEAARDALVNFRHKADVHAAVMNAPAPGEDRT